MPCRPIPHTTGYDGLPAWFLRLTAPVYLGTIAHLVNQFIVQTHFPSQWNTSIIIPIAKIAKPTSPADFRPISITPVLSRLLERLIVHTYIYPIFNQPPMDHLLSDQYAFQPTGSTTAALVSVLQQTTFLLTSEPYMYVALISLDFPKAFDTSATPSWLVSLLSLTYLMKYTTW